MAIHVGAIEAGGTKFRAAVLDPQLEIVDEVLVPTTSPNETLGAVAEFFSQQEIEALGIAAFGPITLAGDRRGIIGDTPKTAWIGTSLLEPFRDLGVALAVETDVGAAALAELDRGAAADVTDVFYVTVGTGIGGAYATRDSVHHGQGHSEVGHVQVKRVARDDFAGCCPFHGDCLEGMASGTALNLRADAGQEYRSDLVADYLGQLVATVAYTFAPSRVVFGGGVLNVPNMIDRIADASAEYVGGYSTNERVTVDSRFVVRSELDDRAGLIGAGLIAQRSASDSFSGD